MPLVDRNAEVTLVVLVYRSLKWLDFFLDGLSQSANDTKYRLLVVANDATDEVKAGLDSRAKDWVDFRADNLSDHYIKRVYAAWREGVLCAPTQLALLANDDMRFSDYAIDELMLQREADQKSLPCGLLIESGRIPSGMPEFVKNFGTTPESFQNDAFKAHAAATRCRGITEPGRLFQPVLFDRQEFLDLGGYPEQGNVGGVSGDKILFDKYVAAGFHWVTCLGSVTYHVQEGEMRDA